MTGKQLRQGCYPVARVVVEPTTLQGRTLFTEPQRSAVRWPLQWADRFGVSADNNTTSEGVVLLESEQEVHQIMDFPSWQWMHCLYQIVFFRWRYLN